MLNKFMTIIMSILAAVFAITLFSIAIMFISFSRNEGGEEYEKHWVCNDCNISFTSNDQRFPYIPNSYPGEIKVNNKAYNVIICVDDNSFAIEADGTPYHDEEDILTSDYQTIASGDTIYNGFNYIIQINDVQDKEFEYLMSQTLVFTKIE